jgi:hypothetical protein
VGDPIDVVTGANTDLVVDFQLPGPIPLYWQRYYNSARNTVLCPLGWGHSHECDRTLCRDLDGLRYTDPFGTDVEFPPLEIEEEAAHGGFLLRRVAANGYEMGLSGGKPGGGGGRVASAAGKLTKLQKVAAVAAKVASVASKVAAVGKVADDYAQAEAADNAAMASAIALNAAMTAARMAADAIAMAMSKQMGTDQPMIPPTGTPGMILNGAATVMIGGLPLPSFAKVADAVSNRLKGLRGSRGGGGGGGPPPCPPSTT